MIIIITITIIIIIIIIISIIIKSIFWFSEALNEGSYLQFPVVLTSTTPWFSLFSRCAGNVAFHAKRFRFVLRLTTIALYQWMWKTP